MRERTAMIVEDDAILAEGLRVALVEAGFEPGVPCHDYAEALAVLDGDPPAFCVLDLDLGGAGTKTLAHSADEGRRLFWLLQSRKIRTVIHSGHRTDLGGPGLSPELLRVVAKPAPVEAVVAALREMEARG